MLLLREFIQLALAEGAAANFEGMGLYIGTGGNIEAILYDAKAYVRHTQQTKKVQVPPDVIVGMIGLTKPPGGKPCYGAYMINSVAARKGYGPVMYDIAMGLAGTIVPDRNTVSPEAQKIYNFYQNKRNDVEKLKLDTNQETPPPQDDCVAAEDGPELDFAFRASNLGVNVDRPIAIHNKLMTKLKSQNMDQKFIASLTHAATLYFGQRLAG